MEDTMLKHVAAALIAASVIAAPAFAQTASPSTTSRPAVGTPAAPVKAAAPTKSVKKHVKKSKRHAMKVRGKHGKSARTVGASKALGQAGKTGVRVAPRTGTHG